MKNATKTKKGFTLIEIMIVVVIIGLLSAIAIPSFLKAKERAENSKYETATRILNGEADYLLSKGATSVTPAVCAANVDLKGLVPDGAEELLEIGADWSVSQCFSAYTGD